MGITKRPIVPPTAPPAIAAICWGASVVVVVVVVGGSANESQSVIISFKMNFKCYVLPVVGGVSVGVGPEIVWVTVRNRDFSLYI